MVDRHFRHPASELAGDRGQIAVHAGLELRVPVKAGTRKVSVSFVRQRRESQGVLQPPQRGFARSTNELYFDHPAVDTVLISGPFEAAGAGDTPSRKKVFVCRPADQTSDESCATKILSSLARRAYRRPVTEKDIRTLRDKLFREAAEACIQNQGGSTSLLQRRLRIGYGRAARVIDQLHAAGILGPPDGSKPREVLIGLSQLDEYSR